MAFQLSRRLLRLRALKGATGMRIIVSYMHSVGRQCWGRRISIWFTSRLGIHPARNFRLMLKRRPDYRTCQKTEAERASEAGTPRINDIGGVFGVPRKYLHSHVLSVTVAAVSSPRFIFRRMLSLTRIIYTYLSDLSRERQRKAD